MTGADLSPQLQHGFQRQRLITARAFFRGASFVDVEATSAHRTEENDATKMMIDRVEERFDLKPECLIGDTAYGTAAMLNWLVNEKQIEPHIPVWDHTQRTEETLHVSDFRWDGQRNEYRCPQGYALRSDWRIFTNPRTHITKVDTTIYKSRQSECATCPKKSRCCPNTPYRKIARSNYEPARDVARAVARTRRYKQSRNDRKKVEVLFAHLKRILKPDRLRLRGHSGAHDEFLLAATAQNLRRKIRRHRGLALQIVSLATRASGVRHSPTFNCAVGSAMMDRYKQAPDGARDDNMHMNTLRWPVKILSSLALSAACFAAHAQGTVSAGAAPDGAAAASRAAASYSLGLSFANQWREGGLDGALSVDDLLRGIRAGLGGTALAPDDQQRASALLKEAYTAWAGTNKAAADEFLAHNAKQAGVTTTASGLQYLVLKKGDPNAPAAAPGDHVTVQYRGRLISGTEFDSSYRRGKPALIRPNDVIAGWREALGLMRPGAEWRLFIPPDLAYALTPPPSIPPNALLIFDVSMIGVEPAGTPHAAAPGSRPAPASVSATP